MVWENASCGWRAEISAEKGRAVESSEKLPTENLPALDLPCLFISGTRDPFGTPDEFAEALALIPGPVTTVWLEGGRHDLKGKDDAIVAAVQEWLPTL